MFQHLCLMTCIVFVLVNAELMIDPKNSCGSSFWLDSDNSVHISYTGGLLTSQCEIEFTTASSYSHSICVQPVSLNLDCDTKIEYQKYFVASSINDGELTCALNRLSSYDESCVDASTFFIVFKNEYSFWMTIETADIRVYAKEKNTDSSSASGRSGFTYAWISIIPGIIIIICIAGVCARNQRRRQCTNTNINYTTTTGAATINTGYPQATIASNTGQQNVNGGYHVHPGVTANQVPPTPGPYNYQYGQASPATTVANPSAPHQNVLAEPPPSYESLVHQ